MRKLFGYLIVILVVFFFFLSSEDDGIPLTDWVRDPFGSRLRNEELTRRDRAFAQGIDPDAQPPEVVQPGVAAVDLEPDSLEALLASSNTGVRGIVRDLDGQPIQGAVVTIEREPSLPIATAADVEGRFSFDVVDYVGTLTVDTSFFVLLAGEPSLAALGPQPHELVLAPRIDFAGRVVDADGVPLFGAEVYGYAPLAPAASPDLTVTIPDRFEVRSISDPDGFYELSGLPALPYLRIEVYMPGYERLRREAPTSPNDKLELRLRPEVEPEKDAGEAGDDTPEDG